MTSRSFWRPTEAASRVRTSLAKSMLFHMGEDGTANDDFASRVALAIFALGFLLKRVEPIGERVFFSF